ncbi:MAG: hypothetical protein A2817_00440 [Candidatus Yanofskybacteria bacterium RIFCSPHIGHO2_01_FULL_39_8b]|uniref:Uncharacterized protein n=1 Tax=Candidatus Yanofskybacteria bacterium RIFCSPHIGHO2_01_FULL_39_8b TaxID=1802659 RepID=A0A1F8EEL3_9BACT|nr:MAG: hypothetical protein A2817_00440 [Candidatus Yanofskybacteria bacterium RIFCSPHIGHO2_01_FULL_39_8b]
MDQPNQTQNHNFLSNTPPSNQQNSGPVIGHKGHWVLVAVVIILLVGFLTTWYYVRQTRFNFGKDNRGGAITSERQEAREDAIINNELEAVDMGNVDQEFQSIDNDLNSL